MAARLAVPGASILRQQRHGGGDPTYRVDDGGAVWRGIRTPEGPATAGRRAAARRRRGARRGLGRGRRRGRSSRCPRCSVPTTTGPASSRGTRCSPRPGGATRTGGSGRTGLVMESLVPAIIEQKVTGKEAFAGLPARWCTGTASARPARATSARLWVQPSAGAAAADPVVGVAADAHRPGPVPRRSSRVRPGGRRARAHDRRCRTRRPTGGCARCPASGCGPAPRCGSGRSATPTRCRFGDYHVAKDVGWALTGTPFDDAELAEFLEPWRPHRGRVADAGRARWTRGRRAAARGWRRARTCRPLPDPGRFLTFGYERWALPPDTKDHRRNSGLVGDQGAWEGVLMDVRRVVPVLSGVAAAVGLLAATTPHSTAAHRAVGQVGGPRRTRRDDGLLVQLQLRAAAAAAAAPTR